MGAYLSSPICDKNTIEDSNNHLAFAASSMQGWRMSQEDAHNAILNFDDNTSLFAVYDGHGGAEIAIYCSKYLPEFIKTLPSYREGRLNDALIEGFIKFDSILLDANVKKVLQKLANDENEEETDQPHEFVASLNPNEENHHNDELNIEEAQLLKKEAEVPIEELLKRYTGDEKNNSDSENVVITQTNEDDQKIEETTTVYLDSIQPSLILFDLFRNLNLHHRNLKQHHDVQENQLQRIHQ
jgi:protein phosphatase 1G